MNAQISDLLIEFIRKNAPERPTPQAEGVFEELLRKGIQSEDLVEMAAISLFCKGCPYRAILNTLTTLGVEKAVVREACSRIALVLLTDSLKNQAKLTHGLN